MEDIIPLIIIFLVIFGSAIKKLLQKLAGQVEQSSTDSSETRGTTPTSQTPRARDRSTTTSRSGRQEEPIRLDKASRSRKQQEARTSTPSERRTRKTRDRRTGRKQKKQRSSTPQVTSVGDMQQERRTDRETGPGRPRRDREAHGREPELGGEEVGTEGTSHGIEETEEVADRKWAETPPAAAPGKERTSETPVSGEELEEKIEQRAGQSPLKKAIIWSEILGQPVSRRRRGGRLLPHQERNN